MRNSNSRLVNLAERWVGCCCCCRIKNAICRFASFINRCEIRTNETLKRRRNSECLFAAPGPRKTLCGLLPDTGNFFFFFSLNFNLIFRVGCRVLSFFLSLLAAAKKNCPFSSVWCSGRRRRAAPSLPRLNPLLLSV